jgi:hypothetical protein
VTTTATFPFELYTDCGLTIEATLHVEYTYFAAERETRTEPGSPESIEVESANLVFGREVLHEFERGDFARFEPQVWERVKEPAEIDI